MLVALKNCKSSVEKQSGCYVKTLRSNKIKKYAPCQFEKFC